MANLAWRPSPVTLGELSLLKKTLLWSEDDDRYLRMTGDDPEEIIREATELR
jgi:hypothetical protein